MNKSRSRVWEFGRFHLNESERQLLRDGQPVTLTPKVFDTLIALVERSGRLVEKEELMARLWPDTFVEEGALTRNIWDLRKVLGEETLPVLDTGRESERRNLVSAQTRGAHHWHPTKEPLAEAIDGF